MSIWLFSDRVSLSWVYGREWDRPMYAIWTNGGSKPNECFDLGVNLWRIGFSFTLWRIGGWSLLLRRLPYVEPLERDHAE